MEGHFDENGGVRMVDVGDKTVTRREAHASGRLVVSERQTEALVRNALAKGDWRTTAQIAGIQGAKNCASLVPLCHPLPLESVDIDVTLHAASRTVKVAAYVAATGKTGVEMEALCAASAALLSVYDMIKGIDKAATIESLQLEQKSGGRSGTWQRDQSSTATQKN
jgi:cyclic pyranopterin phosphate synthase